MINAAKLVDELKAANLIVDTCSVAPDRKAWADSPSRTFHQRADGLVVLAWVTAPTAEQQSQADAIIRAHDGSLSDAEKLDAKPIPVRVLKALAVLASSRWATLSAPRKARVQAIIDQAASEAIQLLS